MSGYTGAVGMHVLQGGPTPAYLGQEDRRYHHFTSHIRAPLLRAHRSRPCCVPGDSTSETGAGMAVPEVVSWH